MRPNCLKGLRLESKTRSPYDPAGIRHPPPLSTIAPSARLVLSHCPFHPPTHSALVTHRVSLYFPKARRRVMLLRPTPDHAQLGGAGKHADESSQADREAQREMALV